MPHQIADEGNLNPVRKAHTPLRRDGSHRCCSLSVCDGTDKGTRINTLTDSARTEQLHRQERIRLHLPLHDKVSVLKNFQVFHLL
ncbi:hypothetical protein AVEN_264865-1, partial [Araneus ventricosus]